MAETLREQGLFFLFFLMGMASNQQLRTLPLEEKRLIRSEGKKMAKLARAPLCAFSTPFLQGSANAAAGARGKRWRSRASQ